MEEESLITLQEQQMLIAIIATIITFHHPANVSQKSSGFKHVHHLALEGQFLRFELAFMTEIRLAGHKLSSNVARGQK